MKAASDSVDDGVELLELTDEHGRAVGTASRSECHADPSLVHRAVHVLVFDSSGRLFLQKRSRRKSSAPGKWDSSVGGHSSPGEPPEETAKRESAEELGVELGRIERAFDLVWRGRGETEYVHTFLARHDGPFELHPGEIETGRFWNLSEIASALGTGEFTNSFEVEWAEYRRRSEPPE